MAAGRYTQRRRSPRQAQADERAGQLAVFLGRALKDARRSRGWTQTQASQRAGLSQGCWSELERGNAAGMSLRVWVRASNAVDADLRAYLERASGADAPRDAVHLRHQELLARTAATGGWQPRPEHGLGGSGIADLVISRLDELALIEIWDWFADVGDAFRSWDRKLDRLQAPTDKPVSGCWVVRATQRNRRLIAAHWMLFGARLSGSGAAWLRALTSRQCPMPVNPALLWVTVGGERLFVARPGSSRP